MPYSLDRYGRKWPFVFNMVLFIVLELATGFCNTYQQFLAVRSLYGIAMGGLYGNAAATALEDCPAEARGLLSGMLQQGYAFGYLLATVFYKALVNTTPYGWRPLFWFAACPPVLLIIFRLRLPETDSFIERQNIRNETGNLAGTFVAEGKVALRRHWKILLYMVALMTGFNFMSHGSQDLYPTLLQNQYLKNSTQVSRSLSCRRSTNASDHRNPSRGKSWCHDGRDHYRLLQSDIRPALFYHCHIDPRRHPAVPVLLHFQRRRHCGRVL